MAGFFLTDKNSAELLPTALGAFSARKMGTPRQFSLACGELILYQKELIDTPNFLCVGDRRIFCIGTPIYRSLSYSQTLQALLSDFENGCIDGAQLLGCFVLLLDDGKKTVLLCDRTGMYKLFSDRQERFLTSSFLAAAACTPCTIDETAAAEQLLCGFVAGPDTLVREVRQMKDGVSWLPKTTLADPAPSCSDQASGVRAVFEASSALAAEYGAECGLSGGNDSRLVYAAANCCGAALKSVHTHQTSDVHEKEIRVVRQLVRLFSTPLCITPTEFALDLPTGLLEQTLRENVLYFDGRNAETIGACSQTHTRSYKKAAANGCGLTYSGIAGEIYRNFYYTELPFVSVRAWLASRIFVPQAKKIVPSAQYHAAVERIVQKLGVRSVFVPKSFAGRYFDSYRIPNALSNVVHANNQMSFYLAPFTEQTLIRAARCDAKKHDHCGAYETRILRRFLPEAAEIPCSKGYRLYPLPLSVRLRWLLYGILPSFVWLSRKNHEKISPNGQKLSAAVKASPYLTAAFSHFGKLFPDWELGVFFDGKAPIHNLLFTVCTLYELSKPSDPNS